MDRTSYEWTTPLKPRRIFYPDFSNHASSLVVPIPEIESSAPKKVTFLNA